MDGGNMVVQGGNEAHSGPKQQVVESWTFKGMQPELKQ
jgi:hypothetical protein